MGGLLGDPMASKPAPDSRTHSDGVLGGSEPDTDTENSTSWPRPPEEPALLLWAHSPALLAW